MKSPSVSYQEEKELSLNMYGLKSGDYVHGGTETGVQSLALGG